MALKKFLDLKSTNIIAQEQGKFGDRGQSPRLDENQFMKMSLALNSIHERESHDKTLKKRSYSISIAVTSQYGLQIDSEN